MIYPSFSVFILVVSHALNPSNYLLSPPTSSSFPLQENIEDLAEHRLVHYDHRPGAV